MKILAIDPASVCGWAWNDSRDPEGIIHSGVWEISHRTDDHPGLRLRRLREGIRARVHGWGVDLIAFEDASFGGINRNTQAMHNELRGCIKLAACEFECRVILVHPTTIKKATTGHGRASKEQMMRAVETLTGIKPRCDDEADAIAILLWAKANPGGVKTATEKRRAEKRRKKREPKLFP